MASRDSRDLHPDLRKRWDWMFREWRHRYPDAPKPILTCTYRSPTEQAELVRQGRSKAGPGQSLHNFTPALAFDVAFIERRETTWDFHWFEKWGELAEEIGLEWGGRWKHLVDGPHVQYPITWQQARDGEIPELPPLPDRGNPLLPVDALYIYEAGRSEPLIYSLDRERPARIVGRKLYVNAR
jgi:peptidoglycan L-alanyl-D-glutamate endopeptidase CwlK